MLLLSCLVSPADVRAESAQLDSKKYMELARELPSLPIAAVDEEGEPLLLLPEANIIETAEGQLFKAEEGSQIQFEIGIFGSIARREAFASWLSKNASTFRASKDDLFLFGELDKKTPFDSAPSNITDNAQIVIIPKVTHQFLGSNQSTRKRIADHLAGN